MTKKELSKQKEFKKVDLRIIKKFEYKTYFEIDDLTTTFKDINFFIIKGKKNIGKTYSIIKKMEEIAKKGKKFVLMRITEGEAKTLSKEWNSDNNIPFKIKAKRIYYDGKDVGQIAWLKNLQNERSQQFNDYEVIFFDEFVPFSETVFGAGVESQILLARNFVRFAIDVQRSKKDIKIFCFGNNESALDIFAKFFRISLDHPIFINHEVGVLYWNLEHFYKGHSNTIGHKLAIFDADLEEYLASNNTFEDVSKLANFNVIDKSITLFYFILHKKVYKFSEYLHLTNTKHLQKTNTFSISLAPKDLISNTPIIALTNIDYMYNKNAIQWKLEQLKIWASTIRLLIKFEHLKFSDFQIKNEFESFIAFL